MIWLFVFGILTILLYILLSDLNLLAVKKAIGIALVVQIFYVIGSYAGGWPFPTPINILQIFIVVGLGVALGSLFSRFWPLAQNPGFERIVRTVLLIIPALGIGIALQVLLQGPDAAQAIYLIFALSVWLGSGHYVRQQE